MGKVNLKHLTIEEKEKLKEYIDSYKEIKKEIKKMLNKGSKMVDETGGNESTGKILNIR
tara:strand:+ start:1310 stop:1486 length:177 start_codon:yes stop_codon:yes gene_type:complete